MRDICPDLKWNFGKAFMKDIAVVIAMEKYFLHCCEQSLAGNRVLLDERGQPVLVALNEESGELSLRQEVKKILILDISLDGTWKEIYYGHIESLGDWFSSDSNAKIKVIRFDCIRPHFDQSPSAFSEPSCGRDMPLLSPGAIPCEIANRYQENVFFKQLSNRELEVLTCLTLGLSNSQMASAFSVTIDTIKGHVRSLFSKIEVKDRAQAAVVAIWNGISHVVDYHCSLHECSKSVHEILDPVK
jgi:DNA-binding CsgD family transcriptional regulator